MIERRGTTPAAPFLGFCGNAQEKRFGARRNSGIPRPKTLLFQCKNKHPKHQASLLKTAGSRIKIPMRTKTLALLDSVRSGPWKGFRLRVVPSRNLRRF